MSVTGLVDKKVAAFVTEWQGRIFNYAFKKLGHEADAADATQEIFLVLLKSQRSGDDPRQLHAWIFGVARNVLAKHAHKRSLRRRKEESVTRPEVPSTLDSLDNADQRRFLAQKVRSLPDNLPELLHLHYYQQLSLREIGEIVGLPKSTIHSQVQKALSLLRERIRLEKVSFSSGMLPVFLAAPEDIPFPESLGSQLQALSESPSIAADLALGSTKIKGFSLVLIVTCGFLGGLIVPEKLTADDNFQAAPKSTPSLSATVDVKRDSSPDSSPNTKEERELSTLHETLAELLKSNQGLEQDLQELVKGPPQSTLKPERADLVETQLELDKFLQLAEDYRGRLILGKTRRGVLRLRFVQDKMEPLARRLITDFRFVFPEMLRLIESSEQPLESGLIDGMAVLQKVAGASSKEISDFARRILFQSLQSEVLSEETQGQLIATLGLRQISPELEKDIHGWFTERLRDGTLPVKRGILQCLDRAQCSGSQRILWRFVTDEEVKEDLRILAFQSLCKREFQEQKRAELGAIGLKLADKANESLKVLCYRALKKLYEGRVLPKSQQGTLLRRFVSAATRERRLIFKVFLRAQNQGLRQPLQSIAADTTHSEEVRAEARKLLKKIQSAQKLPKEP